MTSPFAPRYAIVLLPPILMMAGVFFCKVKDLDIRFSEHFRSFLIAVMVVLGFFNTSALEARSLRTNQLLAAEASAILAHEESFDPESVFIVGHGVLALSLGYSSFGYSRLASATSEKDEWWSRVNFHSNGSLYFFKGSECRDIPNFKKLCDEIERKYELKEVFHELLASGTKLIAYKVVGFKPEKAVKESL